METTSTILKSDESTRNQSDLEIFDSARFYFFKFWIGHFRALECKLLAILGNNPLSRHSSNPLF